MPAHLINYVVLVPLLAFFMWKRVSRQFGHQPIRRKRMIARIAIFAFLGCLLALNGLRDLALVEGLLAGVVVGSVIGLVGLRLTHFEVDPLKGDCYVPNPWFGAVLAVLLLGRLIWRVIEIWPQLQQTSAAASQTVGTGAQMQALSPLTMLVVGLLVGYYIVYFSGLLIHHRRFQSTHVGTPAA